MTEADWESGPKPGRMLRLVRDRGEASDRKLRLFAVACVRRVWHLLEGKPFYELVEAAEHFADGSTTLEELVAARERAAALATEGDRTPARLNACDAAYQAARDDARIAAREACEAAAWAAAWEAMEKNPHWHPPVYVGLRLGYRGWRAHRALLRYNRRASGLVHPQFMVARSAQASMLRCLFRFKTGCPAAFVSGNHGAVWRLAEGLYQDRRWNHLPILADSLEEGGCSDAELLRHLRGPGPHVRGCFALDAVLAKS